MMSSWRSRMKRVENIEDYYKDFGMYEGGIIDDTMDTLTVGGYVSGGVILGARMAAQEKGIVGAALYGATLLPGVGQALERSSMFKRLGIRGSTESSAIGLKHRIEPSDALELEGFWASLASDVFLDPLTYTGIGTIGTVGRVSLKTGVKVLGKAALEEVVLNKSGLARIKQLTKKGNSYDDAVSMLVDEIEGSTALARKYVDQGGFKFFGQSLITDKQFGDVGRFISSRLPQPANRVLHGGWRSLEATNAAKNRAITAGFTAAGHAAGRVFGILKRKTSVGFGAIVGGAQKGRALFGEAFELGYKLKRLPGKYKGFHDTYLAMVTAQEGAEQVARHQIKVLGTPFKKHGDELRRYLEEGVSTGVEGFDDYIEAQVKPVIHQWLVDAKQHGIDIGEITNYFPHIPTEEGLRELAKMSHGSADETVQYLLSKIDAKYTKERMWDEPVETINELLGFKMYETKGWDVLAKSGGDRAKDIEMRKWQELVEDRFGVSVEDITARARFLGTTVPTAAAKKAKKELAKVKTLENILRGHIRDVKEGGVIINLGDVFDFAERKLGKENVGTTRRRIESSIERLRHAEKTHKEDVDYISQINNQITKEFDRISRYKGDLPALRLGKLSLDELMGLEDSLERAIKGGDKSKTTIGTIREKMRGDLMGLQTNLIEPLSNEIQKLTKAADEIRSFKPTAENLLRAGEEFGEGIGIQKLGRKDMQKMYPEEIAKFLDEMGEVAPLDKEGALQWGRRQHSKWMGRWKQSVTTGWIIPFMDFFDRNITSGIAQNYTRLGISNPMSYFKAIQAKYLGTGTYTTLEGGKMTADEIMHEARQRNILSNPGVLDIPVPTELFPGFWEVAAAAPRYIMGASEDMVRLPAFIALAKDMSFDDAAKLVSETQFRYGKSYHTPIEQGIKEFLMPFYTFAARNISLHVRNLPRQPRKYSQISKFQRQWIEHYGMEEEYEQLEDYQKRSFIVPMPGRVGEGEDRQWLRVPLPHMDVMPGGMNLWYSLSPAIKLPIGLLQIKYGWGDTSWKVKKAHALLKETLGGRYRRWFSKLTDTETTNAEKLAFVGGMALVDQPEPELSLEEFEAAQWVDYEATKEEDYAAWLKSGSPMGYKMRTIGIQPSGFKGMRVETEKISWHKRLWNIAWQGDWSAEKLEFKRPDVKVLRAALPHALYEASVGFDPSMEAMERLMALPEDEAIAEYTRLLKQYTEWRGEAGGLASPTQAQKIKAWLREEAVDSDPDAYYYKSYHDKDKGLIGVAAFNEELYEELKVYLNRGLRLSENMRVAAFEPDVASPVNFIMTEMRRMNDIWLDAKAAKEELAGFRVDEPIAGDVYGRAMIKQSAANTQWRIDYQKELVNRALQRGELE